MYGLELQTLQFATKENITLAVEYMEVARLALRCKDDDYKKFLSEPKVLSLATKDKIIHDAMRDCIDGGVIHYISCVCTMKSKMLRCSIAKSIPFDKWHAFVYKYAKFIIKSKYIGESDECYVFSAGYPQIYMEKQFCIDFMKTFGFHYEICRFCIKDNSVNIIVQGNSVLFGVYTDLCRMFPLDPEKVYKLTRLLNHAHDDSSASFVRKYIALKYEIVALDEKKEYCRIQSDDELEVKEFDELPMYWFDPAEFEAMEVADRFFSGKITSELRCELQEKLAIEEDWQDAACVIKCEFPAGAVFLKCEVESQKTRRGGGFEYLYLNNLQNPKDVTLSNVYRADLSWVA